MYIGTINEIYIYMYIGNINEKIPCTDNLYLYSEMPLPKSFL